MTASRLVLFSGLPGTGKTTLARLLASQEGMPLLAKDRLQALLRQRGLAGRATADGYYLMLDLAEEQLSLGVSVILDGVFPLPEFRQQACQIAARWQAGFFPVYCHCSNQELWKSRMEDRTVYVPGWTPVGWEEVDRLRALYQPWQAGEALSLDAAGDFDPNFQALLAWVHPEGK